MNSKPFLRLALLIGIITFALACRTAETIAQLRPQPTDTRPRATRTATRRATQVAVEGRTRVTPTAIVAVTDVPAQPPPPPPEQPTNPPRAATRAPTNRPAPQPTQRPPNTEPPPPTAPQFAYRIRDSRCGPNVRTYIEGFVYEGSTGKNDLLVRISQGPDGQPDPNDDYRTGTDTRRRGYYYHNIDSNAPHGGTWYLWVIDPGTQQRISDIAIVKTDDQRVEDSGSSAGSCQSATVNFTTAPPPATARPTNTPPSGNTPRPSATHDPGDDSD